MNTQTLKLKINMEFKLILSWINLWRKLKILYKKILCSKVLSYWHFSFELCIAKFSFFYESTSAPIFYRAAKLTEVKVNFFFKEELQSDIKIRSVFRARPPMLCQLLHRRRRFHWEGISLECFFFSAQFFMRTRSWVSRLMFKFSDKILYIFMLFVTSEF